MRVKATQRCCPTCGSDEFESADCQEGRESLGGHTMVCINCDWRGFKLQLVPKPDCKTAAQAADEINAEVEASEEP